MTRARTIANFGDGIATADIGDGQITTAKIASDAITDALLPAGSVLQVVQNSTTTAASTTSSTYANLGDLDASITPTSASSKILIFLSVPVNGDADNDTFDIFGQFKIVATSGGDRDVFESASGRLSKGGQGRFWSWSPVVEDSPNTTSTVSYRFFYKRTSGNASLQVNNTQTATIALMEISG